MFHALLIEKTEGHEPAKAPDRSSRRRDRHQQRRTAQHLRQGIQVLGRKRVASEFGELETEGIFYFENYPHSGGRAFDGSDFLVMGVSWGTRIRVYLLRETRREGRRWGSVG